MAFLEGGKSTKVPVLSNAPYSAFTAANHAGFERADLVGFRMGEKSFWIDSWFNNARFGTSTH